MKNTIIISAIFLFLIAGCTENKQSTGELITIDVTKTDYPKKELILQDFMDVEYIPLETNDEFITQGSLQAVGKDILIVKNHIRDGDIFIFDRKTGKGIRKINHKGQGGEEYVIALGIILDEDNDEIFVNDYSGQKIVVFDTDGKFKRSLRTKKSPDKQSINHRYYNEVYNFDRENLICYDANYSGEGQGSANMQSYVLISKQDGSITEEIQIPFEKKIFTSVRKHDKANNMSYSVEPQSDYPMVPCPDSWILVEPSADTTYSYSSDRTMKPFTARIPSIRSMNPEVFLFISLLTDRYCLMETIRREWNFDTQTGFSDVDLAYDRQKKNIFRYAVYNGDYSDKERVYMKSGSIDKEIGIGQSLPAHELVEAYKKGRLKGQLKEIAATLGEEDNPVIMLIKHKK